MLRALRDRYQNDNNYKCDVLSSGSCCLELFLISLGTLVNKSIQKMTKIGINNRAACMKKQAPGKSAIVFLKITVKRADDMNGAVASIDDI